MLPTYPDYYMFIAVGRLDNSALLNFYNLSCKQMDHYLLKKWHLVVHVSNGTIVDSEFILTPNLENFTPTCDL